MEPTFSSTFVDLYKDVLNYMGQDRDTEDAALLAKAKRRVNEAYREFLALDWQFLSKNATINLESGKYVYALPDDFAVLRTPFKLYANTGWMNPKEIPMSQFWSYQSFYSRTGMPSCFALGTEFTEQKGLRYTVMFYPTPNMGLTYNYEYKPLPNILVNDIDIPYCPANLSHVLRAFCLAHVERFDEEGDKTTWTTELYRFLLPQALKENSIRGSNTVGNMNGSGMNSIGGPTQHPVYGNLLSYGSSAYPA